MKKADKNIVIITSYIEHAFDMAAALDELGETYVICTDGGYDIASSQGIEPDLLLGDFDSIKSEFPANIPLKEFPPEKDYTDLELAIRMAMELGAKKAEIWGGMGGRLDHTIANIRILSQYSPYFNSLIMRDGRNQCFALHQRAAAAACGGSDGGGTGDGTLTGEPAAGAGITSAASSRRSIVIPAQPDSYLSLFSLSDECTGLTLTGVKYPLHEARLTNPLPSSVTLSVSNEFTEKEAILSLEEGSLLIVISKS